MNTIDNKEAFKAAKNLNYQLRRHGFKWNEILNFHKQCIKDVVVSDVYELASQGLSDSRISARLGVTKSIVESLTTDYWKQKMKAAHGE